MAYVNPRYSISYKDVQGRDNIVYIDSDDGYAGAATALTPAEVPVTYKFGNNGDDEYRSINPTELVIQVKIGSGDTLANLLFTTITAQQSLYWRVRWLRSGSEVWHGYLITDEIQQPLDLPSMLTLRAVCGIKELDGIEWTPATSGADSVIDHVEDALDEMTGPLLDIGYYANWHGRTSTESGTTAAVSGNSYSAYGFDGSAFQDPYDATKKSVASLVVQQGVGVFGGKICMADGKWRVYQRDALTAAYTMDLLGGGTESISAFTLDDDWVFEGGVISKAPAYYKTQVSYNHFPEEAGMLLNGDFDNWTTSTSPDNWTEVGGSGNLLQVPFNVSRIPGMFTINDGYVLQVADVAHSGSDYGTDAVSNATIGVYQDTAFDVRATSHKIALSFSSRHIGNEDDALLFFYSIWLDGDAGTDYYWDAGAKAWTAGGGGNTLTSPGSASKMPRVASAYWLDYSIETDSLPDTGTIRVYLWNVVDKSGTTSALWYDKVRLSYLTGDRSERVKTISTATNSELTSGLVRPEEMFFIGDGPSINHDGAITKGGSVVTNWKAGAYASLEADSGDTLGNLHAQQILDARGNRPQRLRLSFRPSSGSFWPHVPLRYDYDGGTSYKYYSCVSLSYNSRMDEYSGEWLEVESSGVTQTTTEEFSDEDIRPPDFSGPLDIKPPRPQGGVNASVATMSTDLFLAGPGGRGSRPFPRVALSASDPSFALQNNYLRGTVELAQGANLETAGYTSTGGVYIDYQKVEIKDGSGSTIKVDVNGIQMVGGTGNVNKIRWNDGSEIYSGGGPGVMTINPASDLAVTATSLKVNPGIVRLVNTTDAGEAGFTTLYSSGGDLFKRDGTGTDYRVLTAEEINPLSASNGDIFYYNSGWQKLSAGSNGEVLTLASGLPSWAAAGGGSSDFISLTDTPANYTGDANKFVRVNGTPDALEFVAASSINVGDFNDDSTYQPLDTQLTHVAALSPTAQLQLVTMSSAGAYLSSGSNGQFLKMSFGSPSWHDTTDIAELGTITTGAWEATDVDVAHGGTGASTASAARTNLGLAIGSDVQAYDSDLNTIAGFSPTTGQMIYAQSNAWNMLAAGSNGEILRMSFGTPGWEATTSITAVGTIATGTWQGTAIADSYIASAATWDAKLSDITGEPLSDLSDVTITTIGTGELLKWNGSAWVNNTLAEAGIQPLDSDLSTIAGLSPTTGQIIFAQSNSWTMLTAGTNGQFLKMSLGTPSWHDTTDITEIGTITTGTWNGSVIASAYLDSDTAHLTTTQTFSGAKTFSAVATFDAGVRLDHESGDLSGAAGYHTVWARSTGERLDYISGTGNVHSVTTNRKGVSALYSRYGQITVTSTTAVDFLGDSGSYVGTSTVPANVVLQGSVFRIMARGTRQGNNSDSHTYTLKLGTTTLLSYTYTPTNTFGGYDGWKFEALVSVATTGASGTVWAQGQFHNASNIHMFENTATDSYDTTAATDISLEVSTNTSTTATCEIAIIDLSRSLSTA